MRIAAVYTGMRDLPKVMEARLAEQGLSEIKFNHICDSGLMRDIIAEGGLSEQTKNRVLWLLDSACEIKPDAVLVCCSSIGEVADYSATLHPGQTILRIDYPMARRAVENYGRIAVMGTLETTIQPSENLVRRLAAEAGKKVELVSSVAQGAYAATVAGDKAKAFELMKDTALELSKKADVLLLAQASMGAHAQELSAYTGIEVWGSPGICAEYIKETIGKRSV